MEADKRKRARNFSDSEVAVFTEILPKYKDLIENKRSDSVTRREKAKAWKDLCQEYNAVSQYCFRTEENLKNLWDKLKKNARKAKASEKRETFATGGGQRKNVNVPTHTDLLVLSILGPSGVGLINHCDGDAVDNSDTTVFDVSAVGGNENSESAMVGTVTLDVGNMDSGEIVIPLSDMSTPGETFQQEKTTRVPQEESWAEVVPRMLYSKKSEAIRPCTDTASTASSSGSTTLSASGESLRKRTIADELEWAKQCKRRRPSVVQDDSQLKLTIAKLQLAEATKTRMEEENRQQRELFEIEKRKKESEAELARLQVIKMKRDLGLE